MRHSVSDPDVDEKLLSDEEATWPRQQKSNETIFRRCAKCFLFFAVAVFSCLVGVVLGRQQQDLDKTCTQRVAHYCTFSPNKAP
jgi:hypothetical protein